ncbi:MAG TPA: farnesyl diphosphate synthase [Alphaproteobacteria bacterium]
MTDAKPRATAPDIAGALASAAHAVEAVLDQLLPRASGLAEDALFEAMRYAVMGGGKRFRPALSLACGRLFDLPEAAVLRAAAALELVHCYSLVHDDLPAMDDDDLRRGLPSCHAKYGEATAILAGDALMTLAFEVLADPATHSDGGRRTELILSLARAAGPQGMVAGQMIDLAAEGKTPMRPVGGPRQLDAAGIARMEELKTAALISCACETPAILAGAPAAARAALAAYARALGLAYQVTDDLLDAEGGSAEIGKTAGKDAAAGKATFVATLGLEGARAEAARLLREAGQNLDFFGEKADFLRDLTRFVLERRK